LERADHLVGFLFNKIKIALKLKRKVKKTKKKIRNKIENFRKSKRYD